MANMSYCRFQNTLVDFMDCSGVMSDYIHDPEDTLENEGKLSRDERRAMLQLFNEMTELLGCLGIDVDTEEFEEARKCLEEIPHAAY